MSSEVPIPEEAVEAANAQYVGNEFGVERAVRAAAPLIVAAERARMLPELEWLFEHAVDYDVPGALRLILDGTWSLAAAKEADQRQTDRRAPVLRGEGQTDAE